MDSVSRRPRLATAWLGGCSGCHMSFLDLDERLIDLAGIADVCYTPIADIKEFPEHVDITLVEGAVANEDHLREIRRIRQRSRDSGGLRRLRGHRERHRPAQFVLARRYSESRLQGYMLWRAERRPGQWILFRGCSTASCASTTWFRWIISCPAARPRQMRFSLS